MSFKGLIATLLNRRELSVPSTWPLDWPDRLIKKHNAETWFSYIIKDRKNRWDVWQTGFWVARKLPANAHILETGCGMASNLIWLGQQGFVNLDGTDLEPNAIAAAKELADLLHIKVNLRVENGLNPTFPYSYKYDVVFALNWTHLLAEFDISTFLAKYSEGMNPGAILIIDVIDSSYNTMPNNQYLTSDLGKPERERSQSEYKKRYSQAEVQKAAEKNRFELIQDLYDAAGKIPKHVYILQRKS